MASPASISNCIGESLIELLSTPLEGAGEGVRVGPSDSEVWFNIAKNKCNILC